MEGNYGIDIEREFLGVGSMPKNEELSENTGYVAPDVAGDNGRDTSGPKVSNVADQAAPKTLDRHFGIWCNISACAPEEADHGWIAGDRYKCTICQDMDVCADCKALHYPKHPLTKFITSVTKLEPVENDVKQARLINQLQRK